MGKYGLIGQSISNSLSPQIHSAIFKSLNLDATYELFEINDFDKEIRALLSSSYDGFNVTIPYKQSIIAYLNKLDQSAIDAGAVNTIKKESAGWVGYNTDGGGFLASVKGKINTDDRLLLMGTGGAAFGIASALIADGFQTLTCVGRSSVALEPLLSHLEKRFSIAPKSLLYKDVQMDQYNVIINATSVGMTGSDQELPIDLGGVSPAHVVVDIVYKPRLTPLIKIAEEKGAKTIGGIHMLCAQALASESIWQDCQYEYRDFEKQLLEVTKAVGL